MDKIGCGADQTFHVRNAGPERPTIRDPIGSLSDGALSEHGIEMADEQEAGTAPPAPQRAHDGVPEVGVRMDRDVGAEALQEPRGPAADPVHAGLRIAPAVDVDEGREVVQIGGQRLRNERMEVRELGS